MGYTNIDKAKNYCTLVVINLSCVQNGLYIMIIINIMFSRRVNHISACIIIINLYRNTLR